MSFSMQIACASFRATQLHVSVHTALSTRKVSDRFTVQSVYGSFIVMELRIGEEYSHLMRITVYL